MTKHVRYVKLRKCEESIAKVECVCKYTCTHTCMHICMHAHTVGRHVSPGCLFNLLSEHRVYC